MSPFRLYSNILIFPSRVSTLATSNFPCLRSPLTPRASYFCVHAKLCSTWDRSTWIYLNEMLLNVENEVREISGTIRFSQGRYLLLLFYKSSQTTQFEPIDPITPTTLDFQRICLETIAECPSNPFHFLGPLNTCYDRFSSRRQIIKRKVTRCSTDFFFFFSADE